MGKNKLFVNADTELLYYVYVSNKANTNSFERALKSYAKGYAKKGITDFLATCFCQNSFFPSKIMPWAGNKFYQKEENGVKVDYTEHERIKCLVDIYSNIKSDPFEILIKEFKKHKINAWLSVRMNDSHCQLEETSFLRSELFYQAKKNGWTVNQSAFSPYFENCLDYGVKEVRDRMLSYLIEILDKFDVDGIELDFQRELFCFDYLNNKNCHLIMTEFIEKLRIYASQKEKERGHKIKIGVRLCGDINNNKIFGFDVKTWIEKGLVDVVVPTSRWENTDSNLRIEEWKQMIANGPVELMAGIEYFLFQPYVNNVKTIKGFASQYLDAGANGIYLFNWFRTRQGKKKITKKEIDSIKKIKVSLYNQEFGSNEKEKKLRKIWRACSNVKNAKSGERRHVMTFQEDCVVPKGKQAFRPLPCELRGEKTFTMQTGNCYNNACTLYVGIERGGKIESAIIDKKRAVYLGETQNATIQNPIIDGDFPPNQKELLTAKYLAFEFEGGSGIEREITLIGDCKLLYLEVAVSELNFKKFSPKNRQSISTYSSEQRLLVDMLYKFNVDSVTEKIKSMLP